MRNFRSGAFQSHQRLNFDLLTSFLFGNLQHKVQRKYKGMHWNTILPNYGDIAQRYSALETSEEDVWSEDVQVVKWALSGCLIKIRVYALCLRRFTVFITQLAVFFLLISPSAKDFLCVGYRYHFRAQSMRPGSIPRSTMLWIGPGCVCHTPDLFNWENILVSCHPLQTKITKKYGSKSLQQDCTGHKRTRSQGGTRHGVKTEWEYVGANISKKWACDLCLLPVGKYRISFLGLKLFRLMLITFSTSASQNTCEVRSMNGVGGAGTKCSFSATRQRTDVFCLVFFCVT